MTRYEVFVLLAVLLWTVAMLTGPTLAGALLFGGGLRFAVKAQKLERVAL